MIKKNKKLHTNFTNNNLLNLLFKSKILYGTFFSTTNPELVPFIYGIRHKYSIINIKIVALFLKRIFKIIKATKKKYGYILIIGNSQDINFLTNKLFIKDQKQILLFKDVWINGLITNNLIKSKIGKFLKKKKINLIIILKSDIKEQFLLTELATLKVPIISLLSTASQLKNINYPIIANTVNIKSIYILMYLLRKIF